jgi:hypothetical protein
MRSATVVQVVVEALLLSRLLGPEQVLIDLLARDRARGAGIHARRYHAAYVLSRGFGGLRGGWVLRPGIRRSESDCADRYISKHLHDEHLLEEGWKASADGWRGRRCRAALALSGSRSRMVLP